MMKPHTFFIPVMGIGFTIDTPLKVARYGVSSVVSLVDDTFIEQMRRYHCQEAGEPYQEIARGEEDARARRITAYLDLVDRLVAGQVEALKNSPFEKGSEITRYFRLLPEGPLKSLYDEMVRTPDPEEKTRMQEKLRGMIVPGSIDVNIMTKVDRTVYKNGEALPPEYSDARSALKGFAKSTVRSSTVFSAGLNPALYTYTANFDDFFPDASGLIKKKITLKVSDFRSAEIQGKFLAKKGLWVSEYRVESGLNCGGHAFPTPGHLLGPILDEFRSKREQLIEQTYEVFSKALRAANRVDQGTPPEIRITASGGIGTAEEHEFLLKYYHLDSAGWGTPFLLVPEVTNVDEEHLQKLCEAGPDDIFLSAASPLKVPFWNLRNSGSEMNRRKLIEEGRPGSPCPKGHAKIFDREFTSTPECISTRNYISQKLSQLEKEDIPEARKEWLRKDILAKSCICHDLSGGARLKYGIDKTANPAICCGPGIVNFNRIASLEEMVDHIYGRLSLLARSDRPQMFLRELSLYVDHLKEEAEKFTLGVTTNGPKYYHEFRENLSKGIEYYRSLAKEFVEDRRQVFLAELKEQKEALEKIFASMPDEMLAGNGA
ncbi:MAG: hypothetical protein JXR72_03830 [Proteobacteria bacterium]|nr:hypothetical protein [Pseudomonadota bacterium]